jgi:sensor domain CHASE-containing protein
MTPEEFAVSGEEQHLRTHLLDLRCPDSEFDDSSQLIGSHIDQSVFDAIRINSWPVLKAMSKLTDTGAPFTRADVPYVIWEPFDLFIDHLGIFQVYLDDLRENSPKLSKK